MRCFWFFEGGCPVQPPGNYENRPKLPQKEMAIWTNHQFSGTMSDYVKLWCDGIVEMYQSSRITWVFIIKFRYINCLQHIVMMIPDVEFTRYPKTSWPRDPAQPYQIHWDPFARTVLLWKIVIFQPRKMGRKRHETDARHPVRANLISPTGSGGIQIPDLCLF